MKLNHQQCIRIIILVLGAIGAAFQAQAEETSHLAFVTEYTRQLAAREDLREKVEKELNACNLSRDILTATIHSNTLIQLNLRSQISALKSMHLDPPFNSVIPTIIECYGQLIDLSQDTINISSVLLGGPKGDVDYGKLAAELPKIRALMDHADESLFKITPMIFMTLIDQKPDSKNHLSHLIITKKEKEKLLHDLTASFGKKLEQKNQNYIVSSASLLKAYLSKDFKCSDEPWQ